MATFTPVCWERARFLWKRVRGAMLAHRFPSEAEEGKREEDGSLIKIDEPFVCAESEGGRVEQQKTCDLSPVDDAQDEKARGQNGAWTADKNERMPIVQVTVLLTERRHLHFVYNATEAKGKGYINFSRWHDPFITPEDLSCRLCANTKPPETRWRTAAPPQGGEEGKVAPTQKEGWRRQHHSTGGSQQKENSRGRSLRTRRQFAMWGAFVSLCFCVFPCPCKRLLPFHICSSCTECHTAVPLCPHWTRVHSDWVVRRAICVRTLSAGIPSACHPSLCLVQEEPTIIP